MAKKKLKKQDFESIIKPLPLRERERLKLEEINPEFLNEGIQKAQKAMNRDKYFGIPWFLAYSVAWFKLGAHNITLSIFVIGLVYFCYAIFTTGSYGANRKRVKVYEELLQKLK